MVRLPNMAKRLRQDMPQCERLLWDIVRNRKFHGYKFRRQVPVDKYVADFLCEEKRLIIELDGPYHDEKEDALRTARLQQFGYEIIRFKNDDILNNFEFCLSEMETVLTTNDVTPHPNPSPCGRGAIEGVST